MDPTLVKDYGLVGAIIVALFVLLRQLMVWMQGRIDAKDAQLQEQHSAAMKVAERVIELSEKSTQAIADLSERIKTGFDAICQRLDETK